MEDFISLYFRIQKQNYVGIQTIAVVENIVIVCLSFYFLQSMS